MFFPPPQTKKSITSHLCTVSDFAIEMFDVLDAINYQSYNDFVLRVGEWPEAQTSQDLLTSFCTGRHGEARSRKFAGKMPQSERVSSRKPVTWSSGSIVLGILWRACDRRSRWIPEKPGVHSAILSAETNQNSNMYRSKTFRAACF